MINPPAELAVDFALAKLCLKADDSDERDTEIRSLVLGITLRAEHETGRAFIHQDWRVSQDRFCGEIRLPKAPLVQVLSVKYYDANNVQQTLPTSEYQVDGVSEPGRILLAAGKSWPSTFARVNAVTVDYRVGYGATHEAVPGDVKSYILGMLALRFDPPATGAEAAEENLSGLLDASKVY
jgi:uncharacterized phiE125 gp8 family phage protein